MKQMSAVILFAMLTAVTALAEERVITVETMAPSVVMTVPLSGDTEVNPDLQEITVAFSKDMMTDRMWSVCQISEEHYPKKRKDLYYKDDRTFVFPVRLEPGKTYVMWFNPGQYNSFRDVNGNPAVPYQLVFKTKDK